MRVRRSLFVVCLTILFTGFTAVSVLPQYDDDWERVRGDRVPSDAVAGGYEVGGTRSVVCRSRYNGEWIAGKAFGGRCYFASGRDERSTSEYQVLTGPEGEFIWRNLNESDTAVSVGSDSFVCRVAEEGGLYPGNLEDGRCRYSANGRSNSSSRYEILEGRRPRFDILRASERGDLQGVRAAIRAGQSVDRRGKEGRTPLMIAAANGHESIVDELIDRGASINAGDDKGNTALIIASGEGKEGIVRTLLRQDAIAGIVNDEGDAALTIAAVRGKVGVLRILIRDGSFPGINSDESGTAFRKAAANGKEDSLKVFVRNGINVDIEDPETFRTALMEASAGKHGDTIRYLLENRAEHLAIDREGFSAFQLAAIANSDKTLKVFMEGTRKVAAADEEARRGLRAAARFGKRDSLEYLIKAGVDINSRDSFNGFTALMWAAAEGREGATEMLIKAGAEIDAQNDQGETALMLAAANSKTNTLKELIAAGAGIFIRDRNGRTALDLAIENGHDDTRKELEKAGAAKPQ